MKFYSHQMMRFQEICDTNDQWRHVLIISIHCDFRYQPDTAYGRSKLNSDREGEVESELTESESHLNMLNKDRALTLNSLLKPPLLPTEQTSTVVNVSVGVIGKFR